MKKFSNITGSKVGKEPEVKETKVSESDDFISKVQFLMDNFLTIQTYGPIDRYQRAGTIKISGKELFLEALLGLLESKKSKDIKSLLEGLKRETGDWEMLDNNIDKITNVEFDITKESNIIKQKKSISKILERYDDKELSLNMIKDSVSKIKTFETSECKYLASLSIKESNKYDSELIDEVVGLYESVYLKLKK